MQIRMFIILKRCNPKNSIKILDCCARNDGDEKILKIPIQTIAAQYLCNINDVFSYLGY